MDKDNIGMEWQKTNKKIKGAETPFRQEKWLSVQHMHPSKTVLSIPVIKSVSTLMEISYFLFP